MNKATIDENASNCSPTTSNNSEQSDQKVAATSRTTTSTMMEMMSTTIPIYEPTSSDILCGKDKTYSKHEGNLRFRQLIQDYVEPYQAATSKQQKMHITKEIVRHLETVWSARFLKMVISSGGTEWEEISTQNARDKTSHALRFAAGKHHKGSHKLLSRSHSTASAPSAARTSARKFKSQSKSKSNSNHCRHVSVDTWTKHSSQSQTPYTSTNQSHDSSSDNSVASHHHHDGAMQVLEGAAVVQTLFDRQQVILLQMRKDLEYNDSSSNSDDAEVQAITQCITSAHVTSTTATPSKPAAAPATTEEREVEVPGDDEEEEEFNTLRAEDLEKLFGDPLHVGDWDNVMDLTR
jgi:hypothetical protein